jgi:hypothetical protein
LPDVQVQRAPVLSLLEYTLAIGSLVLAGSPIHLYALDNVGRREDPPYCPEEPGRTGLPTGH